jgi:pyridoxal 5'-phosphate synthase pdxS subunit
MVAWQVLTPADEIHHINKHNFKVPFVCGCRDLGEALRRIAEGAAMIRTKVSPAGEDNQLSSLSLLTAELVHLQSGDCLLH